MTGLLTTALMGYFAMSGFAGTAFAATSASTTDALPQAPTQILQSVSMTAYNAVPEQTDEDPTTTASGAYSNPDIVAARSVDLADELPFGTVIAITQTGSTTPSCGIGLVKDFVGYRVIADSMHPRKRNQIDILFDTDAKVTVGGKQTSAARAFGMCKNVEITVVGHVDVFHMPKTQTEIKIALGKAAFSVAK